MAGFYNAVDDGYGASAKEQSANSLQNWWSSGKGLTNQIFRWFNVGNS